MSSAMRKPSRLVVDEFAFQFLGGSEGHAVHQGIEFAVARFQLLEELGNFLVARDITLKGLGIRQRGNQVVGFLFQALVLVGDGQLRSGLLHLLRNRPGNAALVGYAKDCHRPPL